MTNLHQVDAERLRNLFHQIGESLTVREARDVVEGNFQVIYTYKDPLDV